MPLNLPISQGFLAIAILAYCLVLVFIITLAKKKQGKNTAFQVGAIGMLLPISFFIISIDWNLFIQNYTHEKHLESQEQQEQELSNSQKFKKCLENPEPEAKIMQMVAQGRVHIKPGVDLSGICPPIANQLPIIVKVFYSSTGLIPTITSATEGDHARNSQHYRGLAIDMRIKNMTGEHQDWIAAQLKKYLSNRWIVFHGDDNHLDHIHIEYRP
jgi:ABC-type nickel/cobalt efflux system permease component RcnA